MDSFKQTLEAMFKSPAVIGVYQADANTGLKAEPFKQQYPGADFEPVTYLPDGNPMFYCTHSADFVCRHLNEGARYGFFVEENRSVTDSEILSVEGHDFAVIRGRYIVDLWISHYAELTPKTVFDMADPKDHSLITAYYGDPGAWCYYDPISGLSYEAEEVPEALQVKLTGGVEVWSDAALELTPWRP